MNLMDGLVTSILTQKSSVGSREETSTVSGTTPSIAAADQTLYLCGELTSLTITSLPATGLFEIVFCSGAAATQVTLPGNVLLPDGMSIETNSICDISIRVCSVGSITYGLAAVQAWPVPSAQA